jgi:hypothetical protein
VAISCAAAITVYFLTKDIPSGNKPEAIACAISIGNFV